MKVLAQKQCKIAFLVVLLPNLFVLVINLVNQLFDNAAYKFFEAIFEEYEHCKKVMKKHFNKDLITTEDEKQFKSSTTCWIREKCIKDEKVKRSLSHNWNI